MPPIPQIFRPSDGPVAILCVVCLSNKHMHIMKISLSLPLPVTLPKVLCMHQVHRYISAIKLSERDVFLINARSFENGPLPQVYSWVYSTTSTKIIVNTNRLWQDENFSSHHEHLFFKFFSMFLKLKLDDMILKSELKSELIQVERKKVQTKMKRKVRAIATIKLSGPQIIPYFHVPMYLNL